MKNKQIVPYLTDDGFWWVGIDIYNYSDESTEVDIIFYDYNGTKKGVINKGIQSYSHNLISRADFNDFIDESDNNGRFTLHVIGDNIKLTVFQGNITKGSFCIIPTHNVSDEESRSEYYKKYWNTKHTRREFTAQSGNLVNSTQHAHKPIELLITPNDPVIVKDLKDNNLVVEDSYHCDEDIFKIYNHTRIKTINPFVYDHDQNTTGFAEYWMEPWELRQIGKGDCDDWASEMVSYLIAAGVPNWRVRVVIGQTFGGIGHATVYVLRDDFKTWRHLNSTGWYIQTGEMSLDNEIFNLESNMAIKTVWLSFNNEFSWRTWNGDVSNIEARFPYIREMK